MPTSLNIRQPQLNTNVMLQLEVLTPLHIGAATEKLLIENLDFIWEDDMVYYIDPEKLYHALSECDAVDRYERCLLSGDTQTVRNLLTDLDIDPLEVSYHKFTFPDEPKIEIRPFIRDGAGLAYIPGSSIKGAIRSAIYEYLYSDPAIRVQDMTKKGRNNEPIRLNKLEYEKALVGHFEDSIMRYIRPYDATLSKSELATIEVINLRNRNGQWISEYDDSLWLTVEVAPKGTTGKLRLSIADGLIATYRTNFQRVRLPQFINKIIDANSPVEALFNLLNAHTIKHLDREISFFTRYNQAQDSEFILQNLTEIRTLAQNAQHYCVLRVGWGNGFHGITGDWRFNDHTSTITNPDNENPVYNRRTKQREPARYKTRKIAGKETASGLMGFVKLSIQG